jgi:hypothetical protein
MAIDQSTYMPGYTMGSIGETDEERRLREEQERQQRELEAQAAISAGLPPPESVMPQGPAAMPTLSMTPEDAANTEVSSTQVKTYGDGSQEEIVKRQIPAAQPVAPEAMPQPMAQPQAMPQAQPQPQAMPAAQPISPEQAQAPAAPAMAPAAKLPPNVQVGPDGKLAMAAPQTTPAPAMAPAPAAPMPMAAPAAVPAQLPAQGAISPEQAAQAPAMPQLPQPGPGVQVAGPAQMPPAAPAPAPAPSWIGAANDAGTDFGKLLDVAAQFPESRKAIQAKLEAVVTEKRKSDEAQKIVEAAQSGDPKAMNKLEQSLRPTRGKEKEEVTVGDYLKAYMYARLGLNDLAADVQAKITGKDTKFGQVQLGGTSWSIETNAKTGEIIRAKDDEGNVATANTLNKLRAAGVTATPNAATATRIRDAAGTEWSQVPTPQGMRFYNNKGELGVPEGRTVPIAVGSDVELKNQMQINELQNKLNFAGPTASAAEREKIIAESEARYGPLSEAYKASVRGVAPQPAAAPGAAPMGAPATAQPAARPPMGAPAPAAAPAPAVRPPAAGPVSPTAMPAPAPAAQPGIGGGGVGGATPGARESAAAINKAAAEADIQRRKELAVAEQKPAAAARGDIGANDVKKQQFANSTYNMVQPLADLIKQSTGSGIGTAIDKLAAQIGSSSTGAEAIAQLDLLTYPLVSNVPRFEGPQGVRDVELYERAAGRLNDSTQPVKVRLAALNAMVSMLKTYDKEGKNDWTFGGSAAPAAGGQIRIIRRERVQ